MEPAQQPTPDPQPFTPEEAVWAAEIALPNLVRDEQVRLLNHTNAFVVVHYDGRAPEPLTKQISRLRRQYGILG